MPEASVGEAFGESTYSFRAGDVSLDEVQAFYEAGLQPLGWDALFVARAEADEGVVMFTKEPSLLIIVLGKTEGDSVVVLFADGG